MTDILKAIEEEERARNPHVGTEPSADTSGIMAGVDSEVHLEEGNQAGGVEEPAAEPQVTQAGGVGTPDGQKQKATVTATVSDLSQEDRVSGNANVVTPNNEVSRTKEVMTPNGAVSVSPYLDPKEPLQAFEPGRVVATEAPKAPEQDKDVYLADWGKLGAKGILNGRASVRDSIQDYFRWCRDNNMTPDVSGLVMYTDGQDLKKTGTQNQDDERKAKRKERNEQLGNFFMHLGDFVGSAGWGGPEQKIEDVKELTARQQKMRDAVEAKRNAYNTQFMNSLMQQQKMDADERRMTLAELKEDRAQAMQDARMELEKKRSDLQYLQYQRGLAQDAAKQKQLDDQIKLKEKELEQKQKEFEQKQKEWDDKVALEKKKLAEDTRYHSGQLAIGQKNAATSEYNAHHKGSGKGSGGSKGPTDYTVNKYDNKGRLVGSETHHYGSSSAPKQEKPKGETKVGGLGIHNKNKKK